MTNSDEGLSCAYIYRSLWYADFHPLWTQIVNTAFTAAPVRCLAINLFRTGSMVDTPTSMGISNDT